MITERWLSFKLVGYKRCRLRAENADSRYPLSNTNFVRWIKQYNPGTPAKPFEIIHWKATKGPEWGNLCTLSSRNEKRLSLVPCLRLANLVRWSPFSPFWRTTTQVIIENILITALKLQESCDGDNMYITIALKDNIDIRKARFRDVKVNPRTLAKSNHQRGISGGGGVDGMFPLGFNWQYFENSLRSTPVMCSTKWGISIMSCRAATGLWRYLRWSLSSILPNINYYHKTAEIETFDARHVWRRD